MQSQQKKVKWSRGETSSALEERTDTGITNVSVAKMQNCIADIYGNVSRRPALTIMPLKKEKSDDGAIQFASVNSEDFKYIKAFAFIITEEDYIVLIVNNYAEPGLGAQAARITAYRVQNDKIAGVKTLEMVGEKDKLYASNSEKMSFAQQNNYAILANETNAVKLQLTNDNGIDFDFEITQWKQSSGWYAPNGTVSKSVSTSNISDMRWNRDLKGTSPFLFTDSAGITTSYEAIDTGSSPGNTYLYAQNVPVGSIVSLPEIGTYFRVEGYVAQSKPDAAVSLYISFYEKMPNGVLNATDPVPSTGEYAKITGYGPGYVKVSIYNNGILLTDYEKTASRITIITNGTQINTADANSPNWTSNQANLYRLAAFGAFLTPIVNDQNTDELINVESGYVSLMPNYSTTYKSRDPHPTVFEFCDQRLWAGRFTFYDSLSYLYKDYPGLILGSQIAKYNDFKNDFNLANEGITLDILTKYQEEVRHIVNYNGLKIFTDSAEYAYSTSTGVQKQSSNGSVSNCAPIVFGSLCLYADKTGKQIRAMQYELQTNIFNSSIINKLTPSDLVFKPVRLAEYEDKSSYTGRHLFVLNQKENTPTEYPEISVCNFVPDTQNIIWSRWNGFPYVKTGKINMQQNENCPLIIDIINVRKPIFLVAARQKDNTSLVYNYAQILLAQINENAITDLETEADKTKPEYSVLSYYTGSGSSRIDYKMVFPGATVSVYDNGVWQWDDVLTSTGNFTKSIADLENPTVGFKIDAEIISHPISVGSRTKTAYKRIGKAVMSVRNTEPKAVSINKKTGYMNPAKDMINFYGTTGMKREIIYTITNNQGARFTIESLMMNIEYGTLIS